MTRSATTTRSALPNVDLDMAITVGVAGRVTVAAEGPRRLCRLLEAGDLGAAREFHR